MNTKEMCIESCINARNKIHHMERLENWFSVLLAVGTITTVLGFAVYLYNPQAMFYRNTMLAVGLLSFIGTVSLNNLKERIKMNLLISLLNIQVILSDD